MTTLQKLFRYSAAWNAFESIWYQSALIIHQCALYNTVHSSEYGRIGMLFSLIFLAVQLFNFGFDDTISPFFCYMQQDKRNALTLWVKPLILHTASLVGIALFMVMLLCVYKDGIFGTSIPITTGIIAIGVFVTESLKKTMRIFLHCAFKNSITTSIEIMTISSYVATVWAYYLCTHTLTLPILLCAMLITSLFSLCALLYYCMQWYISQEESLMQNQTVSLQRIFKHRITAYGTQLTKIPLSSNFLIPFLGWQFGMIHVAPLKLVSHWVYYIYTLFHKTFGETLQACLAHTKMQPDKEKQFLIDPIEVITQQAVYAIFVVTLFVGILTYGTLLSGMYIPSALFALFLLIELIIIPYEQLCKAEEKYHYITLSNVFLGLLAISILTLWSPLSLPLFLLIICILRTITIQCIKTIFIHTK